MGSRKIMISSLSVLALIASTQLVHAGISMEFSTRINLKALQETAADMPDAQGEPRFKILPTYVTGAETPNPEDIKICSQYSGRRQQRCSVARLYFRSVMAAKTMKDVPNMPEDFHPSYLTDDEMVDFEDHTRKLLREHAKNLGK